MRCYLEHLKKHIENLRNILRIWWECLGNLMRTHWEREKKKNLFTISQKFKKENESLLISLLIDCMKFLISKVVCHHLKLVLIPHYKLGGTYYKGTRKSHWKQQKGQKQSRVSNNAKGAWVLSSSKRTSHPGSNLFKFFWKEFWVPAPGFFIFYLVCYNLWFSCGLNFSHLKTPTSRFF